MMMTASEFEQAYRALQQAYQSSGENVGCVNAIDCKRCRDATFCKGSTDLLRCHYCVDCERCNDCTHCTDCRDLMNCTHMNASQRCSGCAYLEYSADCRDCHYCFGCVGLRGREFCILNQPYGRSEYFKLTAKLGRELSRRMPRSARVKR